MDDDGRKQRGKRAVANTSEISFLGELTKPGFQNNYVVMPIQPDESILDVITSDF